MASVGATGMVWGALGGTGGGGGRLDLASRPGEPEYMDSPAWARQPVPRLKRVPPSTGRQWRLLPGQWGCGRPPMKGHSAHVL